MRPIPAFTASFLGLSLLLTCDTALARQQTFADHSAHAPTSSHEDLREIDGTQVGTAAESGVLPLIGGGAAPFSTSSSITVRGDGAILVADTESDIVAVLDPATLQQERSIAVGAAPEQLLIGPDDTLFVTCRGARQVNVVFPGEPSVGLVIPVGSEPNGMAMSPDGSTLYVTNRMSSTLTAIDVDELTVRWEALVNTTPEAIASDPTGDRLILTHLLTDFVSVLDASDGSLLGTIPLQASERNASPASAVFGVPRDSLGASGVGMSSHELKEEMDENALAHVLSGQEPTTPFRASAARSVIVSPGGTRAFVVHEVADTGSNRAHSKHMSDQYGGGFSPPILATITTIDLMTGTVAQSRGATSLEHHLGDRQFTTLPSFASAKLPSAALHHPHHSLLLVSSLATDQVFVLNSRASDPSGSVIAQLNTGDGPKGMVWDHDGNTLYVQNCMGRTVDRFTIHPQISGIHHPGLSRSYGDDPLSERAQLGRSLFYSADPRLTGIGLACASCHLDGREDGRVWELSEGPRQTPMLAGRLEGTAPYNWIGSEEQLEDNIRNTIDRLGGFGVTQQEIDALAEYMRHHLTPPDNPHVRLDGTLTTTQRRGKELFESESVGCTDCHDPDSRYSDSLRYDVGTTSAREAALWKAHLRGRRLGGGAFALLEHAFKVVERAANSRIQPSPVQFNTPSLEGVFATAPFFHDGSASSLREVIVDRNVHNQMGSTTHLDDSETDALIEYLLTL